MTENICFSGGAIGADTQWGHSATRDGHKVIHYSFDGHKTNVDPSTVFRLSQAQLNRADKDLARASKTLKRSTGKNLFVKNLLRRNWWQIINTHAVYAVSTIDQNNQVTGGTAWAIEMAIMKMVPKIYVFDQNAALWYNWDYSDNIWNNIKNKPEQPLGKWTGIGTRDLNSRGIEAIKKCFN